MLLTFCYILLKTVKAHSVGRRFDAIQGGRWGTVLGGSPIVGGLAYLDRGYAETR